MQDGRGCRDRLAIETGDDETRLVLYHGERSVLDAHCRAILVVKALLRNPVSSFDDFHAFGHEDKSKTA